MKIKMLVGLFTLKVMLRYANYLILGTALSVLFAAPAVSRAQSAPTGQIHEASRNGRLGCEDLHESGIRHSKAIRFSFGAAHGASILLRFNTESEITGIDVMSMART